VGIKDRRRRRKKSHVETLLVTKFLRDPSSPLAQARPTLPLPAEAGGAAGAGVEAGLVVAGFGAGWSCLGGVGLETGGEEEETGRGLQRLESARFLCAMAW